MPERSDGLWNLVSEWTVQGHPEAAFSVLTDTAALPRWWPEAYHEVRELAPGDAQGRGRVADIATKGRLPYVIRWRLEITEIEAPTLIRLRATGDVTGDGEWRLLAEAGHTRLQYTWRVRVEKRWLRALEPLLRPLFRRNHDWVMARGEQGLRQELARRAKA